MKLISVNIGKPKEYNNNGEIITTSIYKKPTSEIVKILNGELQGNAQADLRYHGGNDKAVYAYPYEHYSSWQNDYPNLKFDIACFGENLTTENILEDDIYVGDILKVGSAILQVTQPRLPCSKFGFRMGDISVIKHMTDTERSGFYFSVLEDGEFSVSSEISFIERDVNRVSIKMVNRYYLNKKDYVSEIENVLKIKALAKSWKDDFEKFLNKI